MDTFHEVLKEDVQVYLNGIKSLDMDFCNIISNRMNTNAVILKSNQYVLLSCVLKKSALFTLQLPNPDDQKNLAELIRKKLTEIQNSINTDNIFNIYTEIFQKFIDFTGKTEEKYTKNIKFSEYIANYGLQFLKKEINEKNINYAITAIFPGVLNEFARVFRSHGYSKNLLAIELVMEYFTRLFDYLRFILLNSEGDKKIKVEKQIEEFLSLLSKNIEEYMANKPEYIESSINLLSKLCEEWRLMFVRYLELFQRQPKEKKKEIEIPDELKDRMKNIISKGLDSELQGEKK